MNANESCPMPMGPDERRSADIAARHVTIPDHFKAVGSFGLARAMLRSPAMVQDLPFTSEIPSDGPDRVPVIFLDGEAHRARRANLARFFSPKAIKEHHRSVMDRTTAELIAEFRRTGRAQIDIMSMQLACDVAAAVVGLTSSDGKAMAKRVRLTFESSSLEQIPGIGALLKKARTMYKSLTFFWFDVKPAIRARRKEPGNDVISHLIEQDYPEKSILIECLTYATAGMLTTREFIVMVAWYLLDREELRQQFIEADEEGQFAILEEILRLEPVAALLYRKAAEDITGPDGEEIKQGERFALDLRAANTDSIAGECPFQFDAERAKRQKVPGAWLSFGDGPHRCPGAQVAMHETRVFIDALMRVPGIRLATPPNVGWCDPIDGYELHGAIVTCDRA